SGEYTTAAAGGYYWVASYRIGRENNRTPVTWRDRIQSSPVNQAGPSIVTAAVTPVTVGAKIKDTATLSGLVDADGTGTVTFRLYSDKDFNAESELLQRTTPFPYTTLFRSSGEYTTAAAGGYYWVASY